MADITLIHPQAGQHVVLESVPDSRLVLQFPTDQATMERSGDNLTFTFDDGSSIELSNFYTQYSQESMPGIRGGRYPGGRGGLFQCLRS